MPLRLKFLFAILAVFALLAALVAAVTVRWIETHTIREAEGRVRLYIRAAWEIYDAKLDRIHTLGQALALDPRLAAFPDTPRAPGAERALLETLRREQNLDVLIVTDPRGRVLFRAQAPDLAGDAVASDPLVRRVMATGAAGAGTVLLDADRLAREGAGLLDRCRRYGGEPRGLLLGAAVPILRHGRLVAILQLGSLLNGSFEKVDRIRDSLFANERYRGLPVGTATIFMHDLRISTNVQDRAGARAMGTHASRAVTRTVLGQGRSWTGRAWVVNAWYLSQYDPIRDPDGTVIGMLYIGSLEQQYLDLRSRAVLTGLSVILGGLLLSLLVVLLLVRRILGPIENLAEATRRLARGDLDARVPVQGRDEIGALAESFNRMSAQLSEQQREIQAAVEYLRLQNEDLDAVNKNYMEMLGFVSHGLKNPLGSAILGLFSVKDGYLGPLNEAQHKALSTVGRSLDTFQDMIKNYLDLSRLEKGELRVHARPLTLRTDVIAPVLEGLGAGLEEKRLAVRDEIPPGLVLRADRDLLRIVYDNLLSNALKYGREDGTVELKAERAPGATVLSVRNEGPGVTAEQLPLLFRKFSRVDRPDYAGQKGTGIGLYICREIIERHGGRIRAESEAGQWIEFRFTIPESIGEAEGDRDE